MKEITVEYYPSGFLRLRWKTSGNYPENWGEVSAKQLIAIACLYKGSISDVCLLNVLTGIRKRIIKKLDSYHQFKLLCLLEFINEPKPFNEFIIREIGGTNNSVELFAPNPKLKGVTFGQFIFADTYHNDYLDGCKEIDLNRFVACFYLPDNIEKFNEQIIETNVGNVAAVKLVIREAISINYMLVREWLAEVYPLIFRKYEETKETDQPVKQHPNKDRNGWIRVFESIVGDDIINQERYADLPVHNVFRYMSTKYKENLKTKRKR